MQTVEAATQPAAPTTIYDLLAQRGLAAYNGQMRPAPLDMSTANVGLPSGATPAPISATGSTVAGVVGPPVDPAGAAIPEHLAQTFDAIEARSGVGEAGPDLEQLIALGLIPAAALAMYTLWRRNRGGPQTPRGGDTSVSSASSGDSGGSGPRSSTVADDGIIDAEFTVVDEERLPRPPAALPAPSAPTAATTQPQQAVGERAAAAPNIERQRTLEIARRYRNAATTPGTREYWDQVISRIEREIGTGVVDVPAQETPPTEARPQSTRSTATAAVPDAAPSLTATVGAQRRLSREQARAVAERSARGQPNDVAPIIAQDGGDIYTEQEVRTANALADEILAQRIRQMPRLRRRRLARNPEGIEYTPRSSQGIAESRPGLVNSILRTMINNRRAITTIAR